MGRQSTVREFGWDLCIVNSVPGRLYKTGSKELQVNCGPACGAGLLPVGHCFCQVGPGRILKFSVADRVATDRLTLPFSSMLFSPMNCRWKVFRDWTLLTIVQFRHGAVTPLSVCGVPGMIHHDSAHIRTLSETTENERSKQVTVALWTIPLEIYDR